MIVETKAVTMAVRTATRIVPAVPESQDSLLRPREVGCVVLPSNVSVASSPADTFSYNKLLLLNRMMLTRVVWRDWGEVSGERLEPGSYSGSTCWNNVNGRRSRVGVEDLPLLRRERKDFEVTAMSPEIAVLPPRLIGSRTSEI